MSLTADQLPERSTFSAIANAAGTATVTFRVPGQVGWQVEQITIEMPNAPFGATAALRLNDSLVTPMIPNGDAAAGDPPLPVFPGDVVTVQWLGATPGDQGKVLVIYRTASYRR